eukprot:TRINITY_DN6324_c0_g1_i2.p1 TRINITY_DN6324_c0_g1~~TRINITY_DN6324_c0_g1_i2.p1  ORF type:complete len:328 (+),score=-43.95 TRINITY_DN6324_c0_g1_i2:112-1095(+)
MKKLLILSLLMVLFISCTNDDNPEPKNSVDLKIVKFDNWEEFQNTYSQISSLDESQLQQWLNTKNHSSLYNMNKYDLSPEEETNLEALTNGLTAILNTDYKFQVGGEIIYYKDLNFYSLSDDQLSKSESKVTDYRKIGFASIDKYEQDDSKLKNDSKNQKLTIPHYDPIKWSSQKRFNRQRYINCSINGPVEGGTCCQLQYVHELVYRRFSVGYPVVVAELYLDVKLEYGSSRGWRNAGEYRNITININSGTARLSNEPNVTNISKYQTYNCRNANVSLLLAQGQYAENIGGIPSWIVTGSGNIFQSVNGELTSNQLNTIFNWGNLQ